MVTSGKSLLTISYAKFRTCCFPVYEGGRDGNGDGMQRRFCRTLKVGKPINYYTVRILHYDTCATPTAGFSKVIKLPDFGIIKMPYYV